ncbi:unnamed protein product [Sympodiomycopsis kandeliae]
MTDEPSTHEPLEAKKGTLDLATQQREKNLNKYLRDPSGSSARDLYDRWIARAELMEAELVEVGTSAMEQQVRACLDRLAVQNETFTFPSHEELQATHWEDESPLQILLDHFSVRVCNLVPRAYRSKVELRRENYHMVHQLPKPLGLRYVLCQDCLTSTPST